MKLVIGLTGGIGSGKTTVSNRFARHGIVIADTDVAAREVVMPGKEAWQTIVDHFGKCICLSDGNLNRGLLREIVFSNSGERAWLESVTRPAIMERCYLILKEAQSDYSLLVLSAGSGRAPIVQRLLVVDANAELQIKRVTLRDHNSPEQVQAIMDAQVSREERNRYADDIITNTGSLDELYKQVDQLHALYLELAMKLERDRVVAE